MAYRSNTRTASRKRRHNRLRKKIVGTATRPRLVVTRSLKHIFAQVVDDSIGKTLVYASTLEADARSSSENKTTKANEIGKLIAKRAKDAGIDAVVFDRGGNSYSGRVAAVAEGAREGGLEL